MKEENMFFVFGIDCRSRLDPPIPATYFGNCVGGGSFVVPTKKLVEKDGFICALEGIVETLNRVKEEGVLKGAETWGAGMDKLRDTIIFSTTGSPLLEIYSIDFGWGRPKKMDIISTDKTRAFSLSESRDISGGIEIGLVLSKAEMEDFSTLFVQGLDSL
ncbi:hypothetical protein PHAVU_004G040101 [Phaseolus vulgaris]